MANERVLVVDDEDELREIIQCILVEKGYDVLTAANGEEAIEKVRENGIDLALLDIRMPGIDGIEVLRRIKEEINPNLAVIIMTAYGTPETAARAMRLGACDYLRKPFDTTKQVGATVKKCLDYRKSKH
jgi:DNA-binding NtrC family response regulator